MTREFDGDNIRGFHIGTWDNTYININSGSSPIIALYIKHSSNDTTYSLYRWDNINHIKGLNLGDDNKLIVEGVDEI